MREPFNVKHLKIEHTIEQQFIPLVNRITFDVKRLFHCMNCTDLMLTKKRIIQRVCHQINAIPLIHLNK